MPEVELRISILNVEYIFKGFNAISDLKKFCDELCSDSRDCYGEAGCTVDEPLLPEPQSMLRPLRGNGEDTAVEEPQCPTT